MPPLQVQASRKVYLFLLVLYASILVLSSAKSFPNIELLGRRSLEQNHVLEESSTTTDAIGTTISANKNKKKTKLINPTTTTSSKNSTKTTKDSPFQEKPISNTSNSTKPISKTTNSTKPISKTTNLAKPTSVLSQKSTDTTKKTKKQEKKPIESLKWAYQDEEDDDLVAGFRDLPSRFQETLLPDLEVLTTSSKAYLNEASKELENGFKPIVGNKYASSVASIVSFVFILTPFLLLSLVFNQIKAYISLQKLVIFIQIYLSIYFSTLCVSSLVTGLEPLKFFYATSESTYICIQLLQTLAYVLYLVVLLMYFVLVFSTDTAMASKFVALGQMVVGFTVGFHYYMTVFHRAVLHQPPKTSWKVHAIYATCFLVICVVDRAERRKKVYVVDGGEEGKMS